MIIFSVCSVCSVCRQCIKKKSCFKSCVLAVSVTFSSDYLIQKILSTGQNDKMLNQCFMMLFSGQEPNLLRHNEQAMTNVLNTATLILIGRQNVCKL